MTDLAELPTGHILESDEVPWALIARVDSVTSDRGVAALVDSMPVAIFRLGSSQPGQRDEWYAVSHIDPVAQAPVMARGLIGSTTVDGVEVPTIASPLHKRRYNLVTGACLDGDSPSLTTFEVMTADGWLLVR